MLARKEEVDAPQTDSIACRATLPTRSSAEFTYLCTSFDFLLAGANLHERLSDNNTGGDEVVKG